MNIYERSINKQGSSDTVYLGTILMCCLWVNTVATDAILAISFSSSLTVIWLPTWIICLKMRSVNLKVIKICILKALWVCIQIHSFLPACNRGLFSNGLSLPNYFENQSFSICFFFNLFVCLFVFREGKGGKKRGREISVCGCLSRGPHWGPGLQPRHVSWLRI